MPLKLNIKGDVTSLRKRQNNYIEKAWIDT